jgi:hypothetical protein
LLANNTITKSPRLFAIMVAASIMVSSHAYAQALEPRAYANAPVGLNFLMLGYQHSSGSLLFDPSVPITDADVSIDMELLAYVRTLDIAGHSAKAGAVVPYASLDGDGYVNGDYRTRSVDGFADPTFYFTINLSGAPALSPEQFRSYQQDTIIGFTFKLTAPLGEYQADKLINIGTNRWSFEPEFGISQALGKWTVEASTAAIFYTDNDEFDRDKTRQQDPIYSAQFHLIYSFPKNIWFAVSATYYIGGRTTVDGVINSDLQQNWRTGATLALPVNRNHSLKLYGSNGVSTRTGTDYEILGIAWQYRWGKGF